MDCTISPQNALMIDRLLRTVKTLTLSIDTTSKILFQLVSSDKTLALDLVFEDTFFSDLDLKRKAVTIRKHRFYMKKMKMLKITCTEYMFVFEYLFDTYVFRRNVFYSPPSLFAISFLPTCTVDVSSPALTEILKEIGGGPVTLSVLDNIAEVSARGTSARFPLRQEGRFSVDLISENLKCMFDVSDLFVGLTVNYEAPGSPVNLIFSGIEIKASFFTAVCE